MAVTCAHLLVDMTYLNTSQVSACLLYVDMCSVFYAAPSPSAACGAVATRRGGTSKISNNVLGCQETDSKIKFEFEIV